MQDAKNIKATLASEGYPWPYSHLDLIWSVQLNSLAPPKSTEFLDLESRSYPNWNLSLHFLHVPQQCRDQGGLSTANVTHHCQ